ncbi:TRAP transporter large permease [Tistrella mobilis]|uniref:TRAP transporter large permease protein n=1 Tax=Tistrella mobilis (strain KA081020-065) TaxID=1110502 RepID=I3TUY6_TISMK|nr:TRAP transporter large permease [Tistrella mobilis]AFK56574.1 Putative TRAP transporter large permease protein [Tistrella mobilis KA081020-065]
MIGVAGGSLLILLALGLPVGVALGILAVILGDLYGFLSPLPALGDIMWGASTDFLLTSVPMFILMGELLLRSGVAAETYDGIDPYVSRVPGGIMHTNIASCALFAATSGSSVATAATISTLAVPNMNRLGYNPPLFLGSLAAGGTLGILIPPSINMILYGVLADVSVGDLYAAGMLPGLLMAALFSGIIAVSCLINPALAGRSTGNRPTLKGLLGLLPILVLFALVVGSIYAGLATPTEAAALGLLGAFAIAAARRRLDRATLLAAFEGTARTTAMVMFIVLAAYFLNFVMVNIGLTTAVTGLIADLDLSPLMILGAIVLLYMILGCFMDTLSMMIATTPIIVPIVVQAGFDPLWFGVVFVILIEAALITPPVGMNLFIVQAVRGGGPFRDVVAGSLPFLFVMMAMIVLLIIWPDLALWLPAAFKGG